MGKSYSDYIIPLAITGAIAFGVYAIYKAYKSGSTDDQQRQEQREQDEQNLWDNPLTTSINQITEGTKDFITGLEAGTENAVGVTASWLLNPLKAILFPVNATAILSGYDTKEEEATTTEPKPERQNYLTTQDYFKAVKSWSDATNTQVKVKDVAIGSSSTQVYNINGSQVEMSEALKSAYDYGVATENHSSGGTPTGGKSKTYTEDRGGVSYTWSTGSTPLKAFN